MKRAVVRFALLFAVASIAGASSIQAQESDTRAAQASVEAWLSLIDTQNYSASWDTAASFFRARVSQAQWQTAAQTARSPFGQLKSRALKSAKATKTLPGAPDGEYVVFEYTTSLEQKAAAVETVTAMREMDGTWHVAGYFIK
jgi:hypothetical protein